ncbi:hypothetical protein BBJ28_00011449 [Nothophytophthora sp. Chile5]|nr:hypothetical protein BBJ28_00011449 [Nothophytophthora sp. Chile5]
MLSCGTAIRYVDTLISVCAQRLRNCFSRALKTHNAGILDGGKHTALLATADTDECDLIMMLQILRVLLTDAVGAQAVLLVSERLPSTLVKVIKALSDGSEAAASSGHFVDVILEMLAILVCFPEVIQELEESSTLHRIFNLTFQSEAQQLAVVKVVEKLVQWSPQDSWRSLARHLYDHRCLLELVKSINGMSVFAKVVSVIALSMRRAITAGVTCLHEQMRSDHQRLKLFALFVQLFERSDDAMESTSLEERQACDQSIADAVAELCSSGNEMPLLRDDVETNKAFALVLDSSAKTEVGLSYFNGEAFGLLSDILAYLHHPIKLEEQLVDDRTRDEIAKRRERLECRYLQKLGQLIVLERYDYEFVSVSTGGFHTALPVLEDSWLTSWIFLQRTNILSRIINQLDDYSEMAQHTVVSVLSGIAIEANVIPFSELVAINTFLGKVILSFAINLLRFHEVYHEVLRSVGLVSTLVALFLDQTTILCSERVGLTQIRVEYPTSTIAIERPSDALAEPAQLDERVIIALLTSHLSALLRVLANVTSATFERANGAPVIAFDVSNDGFAYLQIPDVNVGSAYSSEPAAATPSLPAFGQNVKTWPPPDGYSVSLWFRVDAFERKEEREKLYRECFMTNKCIHCRCTVLDEYVLKCSHRACRGCVEALLNNGGECVVCNPLTFYLFRFRSCDGKSVTEAFLKGGKLYMRTSSSRASAYQFTHSPIKPKRWHHVVFTHAKQRFQSSMVSCYLDGILQETVKISYPSSVAGNQPLSGLMGVPSQARRCSSAGWTLGPFYLLDVPISTPMVNAVFAAGPSYDKLFFGASGNSEISVTLDHLNMANLVLLDEYMWDPVRSLIESVETERGGRSKLLRRSLSIASAASSAAAAIVQDIKSNASLFSRIPSAVPLIHIPVPYEQIVVAYSARNAVGSDASIVPSIKLNGRPIAHLIGGTTSMSFVRQLLYVLMDANVSDELLSVIGHVVLVCLTSPTRESTVEANFADVTGFLTATLSPRFARLRTDGVDTGASESDESASEEDSEGVAERAMENANFTGAFRRHSLASPTARLCLSPRGTQANGESWDSRNAGRATEERAGATGLGNVRLKAQQTKIQDLLLDILMKAVQKYDVKENKERGDDADDLLVSDRSGSGASTTIGVASSATNSGASGGSAASRIQLPSSSRLTGFRKFMTPRWMGYFLFPGDETEFSFGISPSTVIVALKLLCALLRQPRYEGFFKKGGFYRLLAQGLPCNHVIFGNVRTDTRSPSTSTRFPFHDMWYALFCALLGTPVDGVPHEIQFEIFYLCKDFELNIQRDRVANPSVLGVIMTLLRRHYNDPVALFSMATDSDETKLERSEEDRSVSAALTPSVPIEDSGMHHLEVLDFLQHIFENMPSLQRLLISGSDKVRQELLEELARVICAAARTHVLAKYAPTQDRVVEALQTKQVAATEYNAAACRVELAEEAAAIDANGSDPFLHHPIAARALRLLIAVLLKCLLDSPKGYDMIEEFIEGAPGVAIVIPPMHDALLLRFQSLVVMGLLDHIRPKFNDEEILTNHRSFGPNVREFVKFVVGKMHSWQRAQHGDGCPLAFACCGRAHFIGGPSRLLELVLFILAETNVGVVGSGGSGSSSQMVPVSSSLGGMLSDKLNKGKKRRQLRQLIGRMNMSRSVELESLAAELYAALNAVVLHVFHGRGIEIDDEELEAMLQQAHVHREVVLGSRNNQDKDFFVCLCRYLLQLLADPSARLLQEAAAHLWIDLMYFQRAFMADLLTIEIRKSGTPPYTVNLMKNGFDVLLEDSATPSSPEEELFIQSPPFVKFSKWLEVVGPPLKELEINMDRVFIKTVMEAKETVHEAWAGYHKKALHQKHKSEKQFDSRYEWLASMEKDYVESLLRAQRNEFRRQLKWRQDRVDRQKFIARQWQHTQQGFMQNSLGGELDKYESTVVTARTPALMTEVRKRSGCARLDDQPAQLFCWRLDFTEGPYRTRKRLSRMVQTTERQSRVLGQHLSPGKDELRANLEVDGASEHDAQIAGLPRRRYSEADADRVATEALETQSRTHSKQPSAEQQTEARTMDDAPHSATRRPLTTAVSASSVLTTKERLRRGSFEALFNKYVGHERSSWLKGLSAHQESASDRDGSGEEEEESDGNNGIETSGIVESTTGDVVVEEEVVDEKLRPLLMPGDEILDLYDCLRVDGMDSCPGVFLLCNGHVYIIDNYQRLAQQPLPPQSGSGSNHTHQNVQARVVEVAQGTSALFERRLSLHHYQELSQATKLTAAAARQSKSGLQDTHQCRFWAYDDITELHKRRYQLRHVALEIFAHDGRNYLITLESHQQREHVFHALLSKCPNVRGAASGLDGVAAGGDLYSQLRKLLRNSMTERWVHGDISNFAYLMHLNTLAGRSYNDLTQYPVFPWVLADYDSEELDLSSPSVYRDLAKPMGALHREEEFRARYEGLVESAATEDATDHPLSSRPFHYGTHYSSAAITLHYLMRLEPFTTHFRRLHGGKFDHADRLFTSVGGAWKSAAGFEGAQNGTQDVKELTPEFFYLPAFLENVNNRAFGTSQTGVVVGDVELPPWANGSTTEFVRLNRAALESPYVSAHLHHWIDLIFGFKQQGPAAVEACNVFYHLTYEGAVDLDAIADLPTKRAILDQITEFGQTPSQLFRTPHPARAASAVATGSPVGNSSFLSSSMGPLSAFHNSQGGSNAAADNVSTTGSSANMGTTTASPMTTRGALASSFLEGGELINRMHTILSSGAGLGGTVVGAAEATSIPILENAAILKPEACRQAVTNPLLASHRRSCQTASQQSNSSPSIHQIARTSGSVGREERLVSVGPKCLLIPPRNSEFLAWGFQDRSVKVISAGSAENGGHGGDAKVVACLELDVDLEVAAITADGRIVVTSSPETPVLRVWRFDAVRRSLAASLAAASASSSSTPSSSAAAAASSLAAASALSAPHRRRVYATMGSSVRSLTLLAAMSSPAHAQHLTALHASRAYSVIVSGCSGGIAVLWDLNRRRFIRRLPSFSRGPSAIAAIAINEVTGDIVVAAGAAFGVYDINGALRALLDDSAIQFSNPAAFPQAPITALAVNRNESCEWNAEKQVVTGHADGVLCVWAYAQSVDGVLEKTRRPKSEGKWTIELQGKHQVTPSSAITAAFLTTDERKLYTGTHGGQIALWTPSALSSAAMCPAEETT